MTEIERLHQLDAEIAQLEYKYKQALSWLFRTRKELFTVLNVISRGDIKAVKEYFMTSDDEGWETYKKDMNSYDYIVNTLNKEIE